MATTSKNTTKTVSPSGINYEGYEESKSGGGTFANLAGLGISKHKAKNIHKLGFVTVGLSTGRPLAFPRCS